MKKLKFILITIVLSFVVTNLSAQMFKTSQNNFADSYFSVDYSLFKSDTDDKIARIEVYYQILNAALRFEKVDSLFEAEYELKIDLFKKDKKYDSFSHHQTVRVEDISTSKSKYDYRTNQVNFHVDKGKYEIIIRLYDPVHFKEIVKKIKVKVKKYKHKRAKVSDIELVQAISKSTDKESVFDKGGMQLIPSVRHKYGVAGKSTLYFYMELYQGTEKLESVRVETVLRHQSKGMLYRDSLTTIFHNPIERQFRELSIDELRPGKYELIITLRGNRNKKIGTKYKDFEIVWTPHSLIKFDYKTLIKQIEIIATRDEIKALKGKETYKDRLQAFNAYWDTQDPTPGTYDNETKNEFYRRVAVANNSFEYLFGNGWKTDRGRVYIMYGEPDQVDDFPIVSNQRPYQEWYYYQNSKYLKFIFVDEREDGDYRLVYPYDGLYQRGTN